MQSRHFAHFRDKHAARIAPSAGLDCSGAALVWCRVRTMNAICAVTTRALTGVTVILIAGRITERDSSRLVSDALDYEGAKFLAKSLALATGSAVHVTYRDEDGEHSFNAHPDHFPAEGPEVIDRSFILPKLSK